LPTMRTAAWLMVAMRLGAASAPPGSVESAMSCAERCEISVAGGATDAHQRSAAACAFPCKAERGATHRILT
jgi:hypothetical protein